jgi:hypothetical protein
MLYKITGYYFRNTPTEVEADENFVFSIYPDDSLISITQQAKLGLATTAYACDCDGSRTWDNNLSELKVYCTEDYLDNVPAGSNIDSLVEALYTNNSTNEIVRMSIADAVDIYLSKSKLDKVNYYGAISFEIKRRPTKVLNQSIRIECKMNDGKVLSKISESIVWQ